jgi:hypothetical protein
MADPIPQQNITVADLIEQLNTGGPKGPDPKKYGDFDQPGFNPKPLVYTYIKPDVYQSSGLEASAIKIVNDMRAYKDFTGIINKLQSYKPLDFNGDGKVDIREIAAVVVAVCYDKTGRFDNGISQADMDKLRAPDKLGDTLIRARMLLGDHAVIANPEVSAPSGGLPAAVTQEKTR